MIEEGTFLDRINIKLASPGVIKSWSSGEVKKAETAVKEEPKQEKGAQGFNNSRFIHCPPPATSRTSLLSRRAVSGLSGLG